MLDQGAITIIVTIITTLGGAKAWEYYQKKLELKREDQKEDKKNDNLYRDDLRERVAVLEGKLEDGRGDKDKLLEAIAELKMSLAECKTRIEFLEKALQDKNDLIETLKAENIFLKEQIKDK